MHGGSEYYNYVIILKPVEIMLAATLPFTITVLSTLSGHRVPNHAPSCEPRGTSEWKKYEQ